MIDFSKKSAEQLQQYTQFQKDAIETLKGKSAAAVDNWEKVARYNLDVMSDLVGYTVEQARAATSTSDAGERMSKQIDNATAFATVVEGRTKEFIDLVTDAATTVSDDLEKATRATRDTVVEPVSKKTA